MAAAFDYFAVIDDDYLVRFSQSGETVRYHERRSSAYQAFDCGLDLVFGFTVNGSGRFVEHEYRRIHEYGAGD